MESQHSLMAGEHAGLGTELAAASSTNDDDTFVSLMQTIRSDVFQALQFIEQQRPTPAKAEATAKTVDWLKKTTHQLQQVIRNLAATTENEPTPTARTAFIDVIYAHSPRSPPSSVACIGAAHSAGAITCPPTCRDDAVVAGAWRFARRAAPLRPALRPQEQT
jgi:hypothetical protein